LKLLCIKRIICEYQKIYRECQKVFEQGKKLLSELDEQAGSQKKPIAQSGSLLIKKDKRKEIIT